MPENAWREAEVALAGPLLGARGAAAVYGAGLPVDSRFLKALASVGFPINLFNLLPVVPLDGGRAVAALHPALWLAGLAGLVSLEAFRPSPILPLVVPFGILEFGVAGRPGASWNPSRVTRCVRGNAQPSPRSPSASSPSSSSE